MVKRCPRFWKDIKLTDSQREQIGIIIQYEKSPKWHISGEYFVVMWSDGDSLDWKDPDTLEVVSETR